ncbi:MAG: hypothetical protein AB7G17_11025 [Phycisphaerales bacterium]
MLIRRFGTCVGACWLGGACLAQPAGATAPTSGGARGGAGVKPALPVVQGGLSGRMREGSFLTGRRGRVSSDGDKWYFHFDTTGGGAAEAPMRLLPCLTLMEMRRLVESRKETATFVLSGEVFEYGGENYLMPMFFTVMGRDENAVREEGGEQDGGEGGGKVAEAPGRPQGSGSARDPSASDLIARVERATAAKRTVERPGAAAHVGEAARASLVREGEIVSARRGRLVRAAHNAWDVVFDNDPQTPEGVAVSMRLLPCRALERMEEVGVRFGETLSLVVSGQVYVFEGENYLLPTVFRVDYSEGGEIRSGR